MNNEMLMNEMRRNNAAIKNKSSYPNITLEISNNKAKHKYQTWLGDGDLPSPTIYSGF